MSSNELSGEVQTTETSLQIVEELLDAGPLPLNEIADLVDISPSTAHRHLQTLRKRGYIINEGGQYKLGLQFLTVGGRVRNSRSSYSLAKDAVHELAERTQERVQFEVEEQGERVFLFTQAGDQAVRANAKIGRRGPLHCSAAGKALLAGLPDSRVQEIIRSQGLPQITENTITDPDELMEELETIRNNGIAFNYEESTVGLHAVAASITKPNREVLGALSVSGPSYRLKDERLTEEIPDLVRGVAQEVELNIKYSS